MTRTVVDLDVGKAIAPGAYGQFKIVLQTKFPETPARSGWKRDFVLGGQWFPKVGCGGTERGIATNITRPPRLLATYHCGHDRGGDRPARGLWIWMKFVTPENVVGAFLVSQLTLLFLLIACFWQRGIAVSYWQQQMMVPFLAVWPIEPTASYDGGCF